MPQEISFFASPEDPGEEPSISSRELTQAARKALINIGGLTYPNLQAASNWSITTRTKDRPAIFEFTRQQPRGSLAISADLSFESKRDPLVEESEPPCIFLQALTYEALFAFSFYGRFVSAFSRSGSFRIGVGLAGFDNAHVDWSGFVEGLQLPLISWRFKAQVERATFERGGIVFPLDAPGASPKFDIELAKIVQDLAFEVAGFRFSPFKGAREEARLEISHESALAAISAARKRANEMGVSLV